MNSFFLSFIFGFISTGLLLLYWPRLRLWLKLWFPGTVYHSLKLRETVIDQGSAWDFAEVTRTVGPAWDRMDELLEIVRKDRGEWCDFSTMETLPSDDLARLEKQVRGKKAFQLLGKGFFEE